MAPTAKNQNKREQILRSASEVFARYGYDKTTLDDIGKRCGLNKASLYYYFKNKEEIFVQVILSETAVFISDLQQKTAEQERIVDKVTHYLTERIKRYEQVLNVTQLSMESLQKVEPLYMRLYQKVKAEEINFLSQLLQRGIDQKEIQTLDTLELAESLFIISDALKHDRMTQEELYFGGEYDYNKVQVKMTTIIHFIFNGIQIL